MSTSTTYATIGDLKGTLDIQGESFADPDLALAINTASRAVDKVTRRRFYEDTDATSVRYYSPASSSLVVINDLVTLTSVQTGPGDGTFTRTWTLHTEFETEPLNAAEDGRPITRLIAMRGCFPSGRRTVQVTGKFGWAEVPDEVKMATLLIASKLVKRVREAPWGIITLGVGGDQIARVARMDSDVMALLAPLTRPLLR